MIGEEGECVCRRPPLFFTPLFPWECVSHRAWRLLSLARLRVSKSWRSSCLLSSSPAGKLEACAATLRFFYWCWTSALRSSWMHSKHPYHCPAPRSRTVTSRQHSREAGYKHGPIGKRGCVEGTASPDRWQDCGFWLSFWVLSMVEKGKKMSARLPCVSLPSPYHVFCLLDKGLDFSLTRCYQKLQTESHSCPVIHTGLTWELRIQQGFPLSSLSKFYL